MFYTVLADLTVALHLAYVCFVLVGEALILLGIPLGWQWTRNFWFRAAHLAAMLYPAYETFNQIECPLTVWEHNLRVAAGGTGQAGSFVGRLLNNVMFFNCADDSWVWPWIYGALATLFLATLVLAPPRWKRPADTASVTAT
jgi:hypothetical protein